MEDVLALYERPLSEREPVVCVDEKPVVLHADVRPPRPMRPGRIARRDSEYERPPRPSSPITWWRSWPAIRRPTPSIW